MSQSKKKEATLSKKRILITLAMSVIVLSVFVIITQLSKLSVIGAETAYANVTINETVGIFLVTDGVNFTSSGPGDYRETNSSSDTLPSDTRINLSNNGNVNVNVSLQTTADLFTSVNPASDNSYKCMVEICNGIPASAPTGAGADGDDPGECGKSVWNQTYTDCDSGSGTVVDVVGNLSYVPSNNTAVVDISITVPAAESGGTKQATMSLVGYASGA